MELAQTLVGMAGLLETSMPQKVEAGLEYRLELAEQMAAVVVATTAEHCNTLRRLAVAT
jgi:hypothetical protein